MSAKRRRWHRRRYLMTGESFGLVNSADFEITDGQVAYGEENPAVSHPMTRGPGGEAGTYGDLWPGELKMNARMGTDARSNSENGRPEMVFMRAG
ncbi:MAG: hypothetical protein ACKV2V_17410 [Blastocatellia bacterium]